LATADPKEIIRSAVSDGCAALDERQAKAVLAAYGVAVPEGGGARDENEAVAIARRVGFPVALKAVGPHISHKTERGLVVLGIQDEETVRTAAQSLLERAGDPDASLLVERMLHGARELMVGMKRDPLFGPVVVFGIGGVFTEALKDISLGVTPLAQRDVDQMLAGIRSAALLGSFRGMPPVDHAALTAVILAVARIAEDHPAITEIDINPLIVEDATPIAADALMIVDAKPASELGATQHPEATQRPGDTSPALPVPRPDLTPLFAPRSVTVVGASEDPLKWGGSLLHNLIDGGFAGPIYPVNRRGGTLCGLPAFRSVAELPEAPDLALVTLGATQVSAVVEQCGERGIPVALVVAADFSEAGEAGAAAEAQLAQTARTAGVTLIGPNCMGLVATHSRLNAVGFLELRPQAGRLSVVSQSGNIGVQLLAAAERRGIGIDKYVTVGNEASTSALDVLDALCDDPETGAALVYLEGVDDGRRFVDVMRRTTRQKPVVVLRGGLTEYGSRAAASHTGAMAGAANVFLAAAHQTGCFVRTGPDESLDLALCLTALPLPPGRRVAIMTLGGGWGVLAADELARNDLELALLDPHVLAELDKLLPGYWSRNNPIDLVASVSPDLAERTLTLLAESTAVDAVVVLGVLHSPSTGWTSEHAVPAGGELAVAGRACFNPAEIAFLEHVTALMDATGKPIVNVPLRTVRVATFPGGARHDPVILYSPVAAIRALAAMAWYAEYVAAQAIPSPHRREKDDAP
jgi:acyl-CoA synthetase (NDP forming)